MESSIAAWIDHGDTGTSPPLAIELQALYQQRIYGTLAADPRLAHAVLALLPRDLASAARANLTAANELRSLMPPPAHPPPMHTQPPLPASVLLGYYKEAQRRLHVAWQVLAAVNFVESRFGRVVSASSAGAQGPMQFLPATWKAYGMGGNVHDPHDAILGAADYLHASGAPGDYRRALYSYNPARTYVDAVMIYAKQMMADPRTYYEYYNWQVFEATRSVDRRITGPGL